MAYTERRNPTQRTARHPLQVAAMSLLICVRYGIRVLFPICHFGVAVFELRLTARTRMARPPALSELLGGSPHKKCCHDLISRRQSPASCLPAFLLHNNNNDARERHTEVTSESSTRAISPKPQTYIEEFPCSSEFDLSHFHTSSLK